MVGTADDGGHATQPPAQSGRILVVCTANVARSPLAAVLVEAAAARRGAAGITVDSAGVRARTGDPAAAETARLAARYGQDLSGHGSRHVDQVTPGSSDLVLTMTLDQRDHLGLRYTGLGPRVFALLEAARLAAVVLEDGAQPSEPPGPARLRAAVHRLHRTRPRSAPGAGSEDVADPYRRGAAAYAAMADTLAPAVTTLAQVLFGPAGE